jgi:hypothetical protein
MSHGPLTAPESTLPLDAELLELPPEPEPPLDDELLEPPLEPEDELELEEAVEPELLELLPDPEEPPALEPPELLLELDRPPDAELPGLPLEPELLLDLADPLLASETLASDAPASGGALALSSLEPQANKIAVATATARRVRKRMAVRCRRRQQGARHRASLPPPSNSYSQRSTATQFACVRRFLHPGASNYTLAGLSRGGNRGVRCEQSTLVR